jgi:hypothetical protein
MNLTDAISEWDLKKFAAAKNSLKPTLAVHDFRDREKIALTLMGDTHIGSRFYDEDLHDEDLAWILDHEEPVILMGDNIEAATRDSVGSGVYEQQEIIDQQLEHFQEKYKPLADKGLIIGMHTGNHESRVFKACGVDIAKLMAKELGVQYFGWSKLHYIKVGKQGYTLYSSHGSSGARMAHTKIKAVIDMSNMVDAEIYAMGHLHQLSHHVRNFYSADLRRKKVNQDQKHFLLTGAYLSHWGSYAHMANMEPMRKGSPKVKLRGDKHSIRVSL